MITPKITNLGYSNLWTDMSTILGYASNFDQQIQKLFANGEQGFYYDPNDLSTMFQNAVGTVPVTAAGQPVGLMLDKSRGLVLSEKVVNPDFDSDTAWTKAETVTISGGSAILNNASGNPVLSQTIVLVPNAWYDVSIVVSDVTAGSSAFRVYRAGGSSDTIFNISSAGTYTTRIRARSDATGLIGFSASSTSAKIDRVSVREVLGNHAYQTTSASRPILRKNVVTGAYYLEFDGSDDFLQTNNIDFTATDKVSLFAGVRKLSDVNYSVIAETGANAIGAGSIHLFTQGTGVGQYAFGIVGTSRVLGQMNNSYPSPDSAVITAMGDLSKSGVLAVPQSRNGVGQSIQMLVISDTGGGNFANLPLYIGRRGGAANALNGHIYGLIWVGKLVSDNETAAIEKEFAKRLGATLNV